jgi:hypothetical protein
MEMKDATQTTMRGREFDLVELMGRPRTKAAKRVRSLSRQRVVERRQR